jgi:hypothetical protein
VLDEAGIRFPFCSDLNLSFHEAQLPISARGHQRRFKRTPDKAALPPTPDVLLSRSKRRYGPIAAVGGAACAQHAGNSTGA